MKAPESSSRQVCHLVHRDADGRWHLSLVGGNSDVAAFDTKKKRCRMASAASGSR